jgi:putative restriction endonuclease
MTSLIISIKHFASLSRTSGAVWTDATKRKGPHKPLLQLAVLDLVHRGVYRGVRTRDAAKPCLVSMSWC